MNADDIATCSARAMWAGDDASKWVGMTLEEVGPGHARMSMIVAKHHTQSLDMCHGGVIFTLADSAFAFACNSYNEIAVAQHNTISFIASGREGDVLTADAREISRKGRSGLYDVTVANQKGEVVAVMRGASRTIGGRHFDPAATEETT